LGKEEVARQHGCSVALVEFRRRKQALEGGDPVQRNDANIDIKFRYIPTEEQIRRLMESHGAEACRERWGDTPAALIKLARTRSRKKNRACALRPEHQVSTP
jgi:hypothetical protein